MGVIRGIIAISYAKMTSPTSAAQQQFDHQQKPPPAQFPSKTPPPPPRRRHRVTSESAAAAAESAPHPHPKNSNPPPSIIDNEEYEIRKRLPPRYPVRKNDVYVTRRTNFKAQLSKCEKLLDSGGFDEIYVHGLGSAVNRAINIGLQVKRRGLGSLDLAVNTSTVEVTDELEPLLMDDDHTAADSPLTRIRNCSAVHIKIFRSETPVQDY